MPELSAAERADTLCRMQRVSDAGRRSTIPPGLVAVFHPWWLRPAPLLYDREGTILGRLPVDLGFFDRKPVLYLPAHPPFSCWIERPDTPSVSPIVEISMSPDGRLTALRGEDHLRDVRGFLPFSELPAPWYLLRIVQLWETAALFEMCAQIEAVLGLGEEPS